jgi:hypothetical protein
VNRALESVASAGLVPVGEAIGRLPAELNSPLSHSLARRRRASEWESSWRFRAASQLSSRRGASPAENQVLSHVCRKSGGVDATGLHPPADAVSILVMKSAGGAPITLKPQSTWITSPVIPLDRSLSSTMPILPTSSAVIFRRIGETPS